MTKILYSLKKKLFKTVGGFGTQGIYFLYTLIVSEPEKWFNSCPAEPEYTLSLQTADLDVYYLSLSMWICINKQDKCGKSDTN